MVTKFSEGQDKQYTFIEKGRIKCTWGDRANTTHDTMESTLLQKEKRRTEAANKMNPELYFYFYTRFRFFTLLLLSFVLVANKNYKCLLFLYDDNYNLERK